MITFLGSTLEEMDGRNIISLFLLCVVRIEILQANVVADDKLLNSILLELSTLKAANLELKRNQILLERTVEKQNTVIAEIKQKLAKVVDVTARQLPNGGGIAFTALLTYSPTNLGFESIIPFNSVLLNQGNAFNILTHKFVCPVTGIYNFQLALLSQNQGFAIVEIVKEGVQLVQAHAETASGFEQGFNSVVTMCRKGEEVWVRNFQNYSKGIYGTEKYTTFTGFLVWETETVG